MTLLMTILLKKPKIIIVQQSQGFSDYSTFYILSETRMLRNHYFLFFVRPKFAIFSKIC